MTLVKSEREERLDKLGRLKDAGIDPYPAKVSRTHRITEVLADFTALADKNERVCLAGRLRSIREHGNLTFANLNDGSEQIQLAVSKKEIGAEEYKRFLKLIDIGDFVEVSGTPFITHKGEQSLMARSFRLLTKTINPLPDKWHGLQDDEDRLRKRYLDIMFNPEVKDIFFKRAKFWQSMREFLLKEKFLEVETPVLENTAGGADARPFITHHNALDIPVYLRISVGELWQKRLMVAGFEKTFEIGRVFRNEGISPEHAQDYTAMEFYWAYADYNDGMDFVKKLYCHIAEEAFGTLKFKIGKFEIDLNSEWAVYDYRSTILEKTGIDITDTALSLGQIESKLNELKLVYDKSNLNLMRGIDSLWKYCRKQLGGPGFLVNVPVEMEPLAKRMDGNPGLVQRFQVILAGSEMGKGFSELNDPIDQAGRFADQQAMRDAGDDEAQMKDDEFVEALEYGMPPTFGFGVSERLFSFLMDRPLRECQIFPLMRPKQE